MGVLDTLTGAYESAKQGLSSTVEDLKEKAGYGNTAVVNGDQLSKEMGAPQVAGRTITGGRRYRKKTSKRLSKKRKTMRRKH